MTDSSALSFFLIDAVMVGIAAWLGVCVAGLGRRGLIEASLGWLLLALAWVAASGVLLGMGGGLGRSGFFLTHAAGLTGLLIWRRSWREDGRQWLDWLAAWRRLLCSGTPEGWLAAGLILVMVFLAVLAAQVEPIVFDAMTYRLSRIGAWLQDGLIRHFATDDPRLAERFEVYACGVELANGFGELTNPVEQRRRFDLEMDEKQRVYGERYPLDEDFLAALANMPPASGIALGFDRLVMLATGAARIDDVIWTPIAAS